MAQYRSASVNERLAPGFAPWLVPRGRGTAVGPCSSEATVLNTRAMRVDDKAQALATFEQTLRSGVVPHNTALGLRAVDIGEGVAAVELPYNEQLVGNPDTGVLHGGAITATLDATCGMAVWMKMPVPTRIATIDLRIDYLRPATPHKSVICRAECYKLTKNVAFARAVAYQDSPSDPVAAAAGTFAIFEGEAAPAGARQEAR